jgi:uncharacterized protein (TIGR03086 family)
MDDIDALHCATEEFRRRLSAVTPEQWTAATACGQWDVAALVEHVNRGNTMTELLLGGADAATSIGPAAQPPEGADPKQTYDATSRAQLTAFGADGALTMTVTHPAMDMPGEQLLMFRTLDLALHAWDLAVGIDADRSLDPELADSLWIRLEPFVPLLAGSGMFDPPTGELAGDADSYAKLLHATGR